MTDEMDRKREQDRANMNESVSNSEGKIDTEREGKAEGVREGEGVSEGDGGEVGDVEQDEEGQGQVGMRFRSRPPVLAKSWTIPKVGGPLNF
jgi:hypothetical protein